MTRFLLDLRPGYHDAAREGGHLLPVDPIHRGDYSLQMSVGAITPTRHCAISTTLSFGLTRQPPSRRFRRGCAPAMMRPIHLVSEGPSGTAH